MPVRWRKCARPRGKPVENNPRTGPHVKHDTHVTASETTRLLPCTPLVWWLSFLASLLPLGLIAFPVHAQGVPQGDAARAKPIATQSCAACHGTNGNSIDQQYPSLAGQGSRYLYEQLKAFRNGTRPSPVMSAMVTTLSQDDMLNLAAYYSMQQPKSATPPSKTSDPEGRKIYHDGIASKSVPACETCHGANGGGNFPEFPRLAGQQQEYVVQQLKAFRSQQRGNNPNSTMRSISAHLSDTAIDAVARYIAGMGP